MPDFGDIDPKELKRAVEYDPGAARHSEQLNEARRNTIWAVIASTLAFLAAVLFGIIDYMGDRKWSAEQTEILKSIDKTLIEANQLRKIELEQIKINDRIDKISNDIELLKK